MRSCDCTAEDAKGDAVVLQKWREVRNLDVKGYHR